jgi:hypothetical protein
MNPRTWTLIVKWTKVYTKITWGLTNEFVRWTVRATKVVKEVHENKVFDKRVKQALWEKPKDTISSFKLQYEDITPKYKFKYISK